VSRATNNQSTADAGSAWVLVVDDDLDVRMVMQSILENEGLHVEVAADGAEALAGATRHPPAVVVLDISLPVVDGYEVARQLRAQHGPELPILAVTADGSAARKARDVGAFAYLRKPFEIENLVSLVRRVLANEGPAL
jgi:CheY-like chemotaxis protein